jgi:plastocyanin
METMTRTTTIRRRALVATVLAAALLLAACSDGGNDPQPAASGASSPTTTPSEGGGGRYGYGDGGDTGSDSGGTDGGGDVARTVSVANYQFSPATVKVASGDTIELTNTNPQTPHTFTVTGEAIDVSLDPGSSTTATIDLPPGIYPFECKFHSSLGMRGTLKVS